eukprot:gene9625-11406_t
MRVRYGTRYTPRYRDCRNGRSVDCNEIVLHSSTDASQIEESKPPATPKWIQKLNTPTAKAIGMLVMLFLVLTDTNVFNNAHSTPNVQNTHTTIIEAPGATTGSPVTVNAQRVQVHTTVRFASLNWSEYSTVATQSTLLTSVQASLRYADARYENFVAHNVYPGSVVVEFSFVLPNLDEHAVQTIKTLRDYPSAIFTERANDPGTIAYDQHA